MHPMCKSVAKITLFVLILERLTRADRVHGAGRYWHRANQAPRFYSTLERKILTD